MKSDLPDLGRLAETPVAPLARTIDRDALHPVLTTEVQRTVCLLCADDDTTIEAAFDEGRIVADASSVLVSEMELELKTGFARSLYRLALDLLVDVPFRLDSLSKAERNFWFRTGKPPEASKAQISASTVALRRERRSGGW